MTREVEIQDGSKLVYDPTFKITDVEGNNVDLEGTTSKSLIAMVHIVQEFIRNNAITKCYIIDNETGEVVYGFYDGKPTPHLYNDYLKSIVAMRMIAKDVPGLYCDDITFCWNRCERTDCPRNSCNIRDRSVPHSYTKETPSDCPKKDSSKE